MGQVQTLARSTTQTHRSYHSIRQQSIYSKRLQHQGLLTLRPVPFKNCIEIQTPTGSFFLQNIEITLKDLLESRLYTNKLFPKEDVERLIENVTYTLAFLAENGVRYKDVAVENVFYDNGGFKLLPNELIPESRYQRFLCSRLNKKTHTPTSTSIPYQPSTPTHKQFIPISPEMIIAYRCKQPTIVQPQILDKSNVFALGLILLETCTLLPSFECYDEQSCDILDQVVIQRIQLVREFYSEEIAAIVANMLDYDYTERMGLKEVSIYVNRQLNRDLISNSKIAKQLSNKKPSQKRPFIDLPPSSDPTIDETQSLVHQSQTKNVISKSRIQNKQTQKSRIQQQIQKSRIQQQQTQKSRTQQQTQQDSRISRPLHNISIQQKKRNKTNKVYMNGGLQAEQQEEEPVQIVTKQERNRIYMKQGHQQSQDQQNKVNELQGRGQQGVLKQIPHTSNVMIRSTNDSHVQQTFNNKALSFNMRQKNTSTLPIFSQKPTSYQPHNQQDIQNRQPQDPYPQRQMKRKNSTDYLGYRAPSQHRQQTSQSTFYHGQSKFDSLQGFNQDSGSRGYFEGPRNVKPQGKVDFGQQDNSLNRIKSEIERSRKLIQEFKRGENIQFS